MNIGQRCATITAEVSFTFTVLGIILLLALVLVTVLLRLGRATHTLSQEALENELEKARPYELPARLFADDDADFVSRINGLSPERCKKLWEGRRQVLSLFLRDIWRDFHRAWSVCKLLAPLSDDPEFGVQLVRQKASFYFIYALAWLRLASRSQHGFHEDVRALADTVRGLRESAQQLAQSTRIELPHGAGV